MKDIAKKQSEWKKEIDDPEAQENIARVISTEASIQTQIAEAGHTSGEQNNYLCGIAMSLASYAATGVL